MSRTCRVGATVALGLALATPGCVATGASSVDASRCFLPDARPGFDAGPPVPPCDSGPGGHLDCFGGFECRDGVLCEVPFAPQPPVCGAAIPQCPCSPTYCQCALGCRPWTGVGRGGDPSSLCIENLPRRAGDPCRGPGDCDPAEPIDAGGSTRVPILDCDAATGLCVERAP